MSSSFVARRQFAIIDLLKRKSTLSIAELAEEFGVSEITIRRDVKHLEECGKVIRRYGSICVAKHDDTNKYLQKQDTQRQIAQIAAKFVEDNDIIFINSSSTAIETLEYISATSVMVITNNGSVLNRPYGQNINVFLTGGAVHPLKHSLSGDSTLSFLSLVKAKKCILGCDGVSPEGGLTTNEFSEMQVNRMMLENATKSIVTVTSQKIGNTASFQYGSLDLIDIIVTDTNASNAQITALKFGGIKKVVLADANAKDDLISLVDF